MTQTTHPHPQAGTRAGTRIKSARVAAIRARFVEAARSQAGARSAQAQREIPESPALRDLRHRLTTQAIA